MLVIISDLHLTDGSTGSDIQAGAFRVFRERLSDMAYDASWRKDGIYRPIEKMDILLLGDVLDQLRSTSWTDDGTDLRPWDDFNSEEYIAKLSKITDGILENNKETAKIFRSLADGFVTIPPATKKGQVNKSISREPSNPKRLKVDVNIHYMVGNHDWYLMCPGKGYDKIREKVINAFGLSNPVGPFPHFLWGDEPNSKEMREMCEVYDLFVRHGDIYDPINYDKEKGRMAAALGDAIVVEIINQFPKRVQDDLSDKLPEEFVTNLFEMRNVYPGTMSPGWLVSLMRKYGVDEEQEDLIKNVWDELVEDFSTLEFVKQQDSIMPFEMVDLIEGLLKFTTFVQFDTLGAMVDWIFDKLEFNHISFADHALKDAEEYSWAKYLVFGHTHHYEYVPLSLTIKDDALTPQIYINSGTWHELLTVTKKNHPIDDFVIYKMLTYIGFYKEDERGGRDYEVWTGVLDV